MQSHVRSEFLLRLRTETAAAHARLERDVGLSPERVDEQSVRRMLTRFYGFYRAWEPWIEASPIEPSFFEPRRKLSLVSTDLAALGVRDMHRLPSFSPQLGPATAERAMGSLYVIEGSTLGSRVIGRWMQDAAWLPMGGLAYFASYGTDVGRMWRLFLDELALFAASSSQDEIIDAAKVTFERLHGWLCDRKEFG